MISNSLSSACLQRNWRHGRRTIHRYDVTDPFPISELNTKIYRRIFRHVSLDKNFDVLLAGGLARNVKSQHFFFFFII